MPTTHDDQSTIVAEIEAADARRIQATIEADIATLEELIGEDLRYVHSSATDETRPVYFERLRDGYYRYTGLTVLAREFRVLGNVVLVNGDQRIEVLVNGHSKDFVTRYLQVWARRGARWQMVSWQSTPIPA